MFGVFHVFVLRRLDESAIVRKLIFRGILFLFPGFFVGKISFLQTLYSILLKPGWDGSEKEEDWPLGKGTGEISRMGKTGMPNTPEAHRKPPFIYGGTSKQGMGGL